MKQIKKTFLLFWEYIKKIIVFLKNNIVGKNKIIKKVVIITVSIIMIIIGIITSNFISRSVFDAKKEKLDTQKVNTINIASLPDEEISSFTQNSNMSAMYENTNFYMFKFNKEDFYLSQNKKNNYSASIYIQKPNNILEYSSSKNYKSISTDKFIINISFRQGEESDRKIDLLFLNRKDNIKRLDNYNINNISFEAYQITSQDHIKYCMVSDPMGDMYLIYSIIYYDTQEVKNFNYLSHIIFNENAKK